MKLQINSVVGKHCLRRNKLKLGGELRWWKSEIEVLLKTGLQARPAALFVQEANRFQAEVYLEKDGRKVNAKSIMGLMSLAISSGSSVKIITNGRDEVEALEALEQLIQQEDNKCNKGFLIGNSLEGLY